MTQLTVIRESTYTSIFFNALGPPLPNGKASPLCHFHKWQNLILHVSGVFASHLLITALNVVYIDIIVLGVR